MISIDDCVLSFTCMSCKKFVQGIKSIIEVRYDQSEAPERLCLCDNCKLELARRILFRRSKETVSEVTE